MLLGVTLILYPTGLMYTTSPMFASGNAVELAVWRVWMPCAALFAVLSVAGAAIPLGPPGGVAHRAQRALLVGTIALAVATNQVSSWVFGTLASPTVGMVVVLVSIYRVFVDYTSGVVVAVLGAAAFVLVGLLEMHGVLPAEPLTTHPGAHPAYHHPEVGIAMLQGGAAAMFLCFIAVNYGVNQAVKLHAYITNAVLRRYLPPELVERASRGEFDVEGPPERLIVTVMFTDLVGFTAMSERLGAEAVGGLLNWQRAGAQAVFEAAWDAVCDLVRWGKLDADQLRLQRSVVRTYRRSRSVPLNGILVRRREFEGRPQDMIDAARLEKALKRPKAGSKKDASRAGIAKITRKR